jgi:hypothetical protein
VTDLFKSFLKGLSAFGSPEAKNLSAQDKISQLSKQFEVGDLKDNAEMQAHRPLLTAVNNMLNTPTEENLKSLRDIFETGDNPIADKLLQGGQFPADIIKE